MNEDGQLLQEYAWNGAEAAFREIARRHAGLVQATARRMTGGDAALADDITQTVFTDLARKAGALPPTVVLPGWLHRHTCYVAAKTIRTEQRRRARERIAMDIQTLHEEPARDLEWHRLSPVLDAALDELRETDRHAILLRYLEHQDLRTIGAALGMTDDAVQKRIARALPTLRAALARRGITFPTALLATALEAAPMPAVGLEYAGRVTAHALAAAATPVPLSTLVKTMITSKYTIGGAILVALGTMTAVLVAQNSTNTTTSNATATGSATAAAAQKTTTATSSGASTTAAKTKQAAAATATTETVAASSQSQQIKISGDKAIITTTKDGVTTTKTVPLSELGSGENVTNGQQGWSGFSVSSADPNSTTAAISQTRVINPDGTIKEETKTIPKSADGNTKASATVGTLPPSGK